MECLVLAEGLSADAANSVETSMIAIWRPGSSEILNKRWPGLMRFARTDAPSITAQMRAAFALFLERCRTPLRTEVIKLDLAGAKRRAENKARKEGMVTMVKYYKRKLIEATAMIVNYEALLEANGIPFERSTTPVVFSQMADDDDEAMDNQVSEDDDKTID